MESCRVYLNLPEFTSPNQFRIKWMDEINAEYLFTIGVYASATKLILYLVNWCLYLKVINNWSHVVNLGLVISWPSTHSSSTAFLKS